LMSAVHKGRPFIYSQDFRVGHIFQKHIFIAPLANISVK
jgi:hypothetical protein